MSNGKAPNDKRKSSIAPSKGIIFKCPHCGKQLNRSKKQLTKIASAYHPIWLRSCPSCRRVFDWEKALRKVKVIIEAKAPPKRLSAPRKPYIGATDTSRKWIYESSLLLNNSSRPPLQNELLSAASHEPSPATNVTPEVKSTNAAPSATHEQKVNITPPITVSGIFDNLFGLVVKGALILFLAFITFGGRACREQERNKKNIDAIREYQRTHPNQWNR